MLRFLETQFETQFLRQTPANCVLETGTDAQISAQKRTWLLVNFPYENAVLLVYNLAYVLVPMLDLGTLSGARGRRFKSGRPD